MGDFAYLLRDLGPSARYVLDWKKNNMREQKGTSVNTSGCIIASSLQRDKK